ncbi:MAG: peptidylprolyl isomerase [Thermodesulfobacteriota bacterium]
MRIKGFFYISDISGIGRGFISLLTLMAAFIILLTPGEAGSEAVDRVVAVINEDIVTLSELNAAVTIATNGVKGSGKLSVERGARFKSKILDNLIEEKLIKQASDRAGIDVSEKEIDNAVDEIKNQNNFTRDELLLALANSGLTMREYRARLKEQIRVVKFMNTRFRSRISIQPEEISDYYRQHIENFFGPPVYRIESIFIDGGDKVIMERKLRYINEGLKKGTPFSELARQYSDGPAASSGGDLGYLKTAEMDDEIKKVVLKLKAGETSPPIEGPDGVHIIRLAEYIAGKPEPLEKIKGTIHEKLFNQTMDERVESWLKDVKKISHIETRL